MQAINRPIARSYLFVPASRPERIVKALDSGAHEVIVDLEDAVAPHDKLAARELLAKWLVNNPARKITLRINAAGTPWHGDDLSVAVAPNVSAIVIPKAEQTKTFPSIDKPLLPLVESALGFAHLDEIATHPGVKRLLFGTYDFRVDLCLGSAPEALLYFSSRLVLASRLAGIAPPVDGVMVALLNDVSWLSECRMARALGFGGKLCIHSRQVAAINTGFAPLAEEIRWAQRIIEVVGDQATGVVDGEFVDRPIILRAKSVLADSRPREVAAPTVEINMQEEVRSEAG